MAIYVALLRGINVSGQKKVAMNQLKALFENVGFTDVLTYIQSGNIVFVSYETNTPTIIKLIKENILSEFGFNVPVFILTANELDEIIQENPFYNLPDFEESKLYYTILEDIPDAEELKLLLSYKFHPDQIISKGRVIYVYAQGGYGKTKYSNNFIESKLKLTATTRNYKTMQALIELITK